MNCYTELRWSCRFALANHYCLWKISHYPLRNAAGDENTLPMQRGSYCTEFNAI